jgi:hypothetical protein
MRSLTLLTLAVLSTAQAAEPTGTLTLACEGTAVSGNGTNPEQLSMGIVVDFATRTVEFGHDFQFPVEITNITQTTIKFFGSTGYSPLSNLDGVIDRMTGAVEAYIVRELGGTMSYSLKCKPTQRMF